MHQLRARCRAGRGLFSSPDRLCRLGWILLATSSFALIAKADIKITPAGLPNGTVGVAYSAMLQAEGCSGACSWSNTGALPPGLSLGSASGTISGMPASAGTFHFTVTATDKKSESASQSYSIDIADAALTISTSSPLPGAKVGAAYSQTLSVSGGAAPYAWSVIVGSLPGGISLNAGSGVLSGTPTAANAFSFTVEVIDKNKASTTKAFSLTIAATAPGLSITTGSTLPGGTVGMPYSYVLTAAGGTPPYSWALAGGALPPGMALNAESGALTGSPGNTGAFAFTARVTDLTSAAADQSFQLTVGSTPGPPATPTFSFSGVPDTTGSAIQMPFSLVLSAAATQPVTGQVVLTFQPDAAVARDDPAVQFSTGGRTVSFTVPAGATKAVFPSSGLLFQTGTVAGTLNLAVSSNLPNGNLSHNVVVARAGPILASATVVRNSSGFQVQVAGFSNTRELTGASFHFTAASGQTLQTSDLSVSLTSLASQWYGNITSNQFGGQFLLVVPFSVSQGTAGGLTAVSVQLQNTQGASAAMTGKF